MKAYDASISSFMVPMLPSTTVLTSLISSKSLICFLGDVYSNSSKLKADTVLPSLEIMGDW